MFLSEIAICGDSECLCLCVSVQSAEHMPKLYIVWSPENKSTSTAEMLSTNSTSTADMLSTSTSDKNEVKLQYSQNLVLPLAIAGAIGLIVLISCTATSLYCFRKR